MRNRALSPAELDGFARELDDVRARTVATLGQRDADYIRGIVRVVNYSGFLGRALLMVGAIGGAFVPALLLACCVPGVLLLAMSKILENMEVGHNVIHGQYDWMRDPTLDGKTYEWDIAGTSEAWRQTHNYSHHTWTNVRGMDDDVGYGLLRIFPEQRWKPFYLVQPLVAVVFAILFEWGVAIQNLRLGRWLAGKVSARQMREQFRPVGRKMARQAVKDYVLFPLLAGPFFLPVLLGNALANVIRNVWTYVIIFCGHFTADAETFAKESVKNETRGHWYVRQLRGSSNLRAGRLGNACRTMRHITSPNWRGKEPVS